MIPPQFSHHASHYGTPYVTPYILNPASAHHFEEDNTCE